MKCINVIENGVLLEYKEFEKLKEEEKDLYVTMDDFFDSDFIKINKNVVLMFIQKEDFIYYIIYNDYEEQETFLIEILENFFNKDELFNPIEKITENGVYLFYRGGIGYRYNIYKYVLCSIEKFIY